MAPPARRFQVKIQFLKTRPMQFEAESDPFEEACAQLGVIRARHATGFIYYPLATIKHVVVEELD